VLAHADQGRVLQKGQVVLQGTADDVATSPALATYLLMF
jgi:ABC-type branched-subunit amino acid transport system ATPase component